MNHPTPIAANANAITTLHAKPGCSLTERSNSALERQKNFRLTPELCKKNNLPLYIGGKYIFDHSVSDGFLVSEASHSLDGVPKCPTTEKPENFQLAKPTWNENLNPLPRVENPGDLIVNTETGEVINWRNDESKNVTAVGTKAVITKREWSGEWRIRCQADTTSGIKPPENNGPRETKKLTSRGAIKLEDSAKYVCLERGGYTTFLTLTLSDESRVKVAAGETTVQKETSRFFDSIKKVYQRGWVAESGKRVESHRDDLDYCWVAECPKNENGEDNPHVHVLLRWRVPYELFQEWAQKIEKLWGQGFAHLEKIKDAAAAGAYIQKAAGYLTKGEKGDQGTILGNRYAISKSARAPEWECWGQFEWGAMGAFINDLYDFLTLKYGPDYAKRRELKSALTKAKNNQSRRFRAKKLDEVRERLNKVPVIVNKYQATFKNHGAFVEFLQWAKNAGEQDGGEWLPPKEAGLSWNGDVAPDCHHIARIKQRIKLHQMKRRWDSEWDAMIEFYDDWEPINNQYDEGISDYENLELINQLETEHGICI